LGIGSGGSDGGHFFRERRAGRGGAPVPDGDRLMLRDGEGRGGTLRDAPLYGRRGSPLFVRKTAAAPSFNLQGRRVDRTCGGEEKLPGPE